MFILLFWLDTNVISQSSKHARNADSFFCAGKKTIHLLCKRAHRLEKGSAVAWH